MTIFEYLKTDHPWLDNTRYANYQIALFLSGAILWIFTYIDTIRDITRKKTINIPLIAICFNFGYEVTTSFAFVPNMGKVLVMAYWSWMVLDIFIVYSMFRFGVKQIRIKQIASHITLYLFLGVSAGFLIQFFFIPRYDLPMAPLAGYIISQFHLPGVYTWLPGEFPGNRMDEIPGNCFDQHHVPDQIPGKSFFDRVIYFYCLI